MNWTRPAGTLGMLTSAAYERAIALRPQRDELERAAASTPPRPSLQAVLRRDDIAIIAEVKRRSPSKGAIAPAIDARAQALAYARGGAAAISVLTERDHFGGTLDDLIAAADSGLPLLKKDFHVDPVQLAEARSMGSSAALLIVRALGPGALEEMVAAGESLGLELVLEVRDEAELERALATGARVIGVNNRDLETLQIDPATSDRLIPVVPSSCVAIFESGVRSVEDVRAAARIGADAVLVGSSISASQTPEQAVRGLTGVKRQGRA